MPPKKDKAEPKKPAEEPEPDDEEKEMMERELVIGHLKNKLSKYLDKTDHLSGENVRLSDELETQKINLKDINEFLTNELKAKEISHAALEQRVAQLEADLELAQQSFNKQVEDLKAEFLQKEDALRDEISAYEGKLHELKEFQEKKAQLEQELLEIKALLDKERREHEERISDLERKAVQEKDRLKKEMALKIKETKANMMKLTDNQLETTTKRTIMENEQMSSELAYQSRQTEKLLQKNEKLLNENASMKRSIELCKQTEGELAKRNHVYQKTIKTLLAKLKQQDAAKREDEEELSRQVDYSQDLHEKLKSLEEEVNAKQDDFDALSREHDRKKADVEAFQTQQDETAKFLIACLQDVKQQIITVVREQREDGSEPEITVMPGRLDELSLEQRERALSYLLEKLHAFQSSKQQRLLGLGRGMDLGLVLPPISSAKQDPWYGGAAGGQDGNFFHAQSFSYPFMQGGADPGDKVLTSTGCQTNQTDVVSGAWREQGKEGPSGTVSGEVREW
eukprot:CAMPEP_0197853914 /NCGR_PEP_ID=MMETSP1438-20131217/23662_1 /TAXON_ID=1461541 /ORGANISM="Pterosperma sp., Strain CCMP1384" /LENGTH=510 /DNA_ID=CAMNT_0043468489 /DNA_START=481 /DNA_END=2010 /DNA_ORIENTATION=-